MASSSVSQDDHDVEHDFAIASRRAKVRSARANRAVNSLACRGLGEEIERDVEGGESHPHIPKYEQTSVVLVESNDASPKPIIRNINKEKRSLPRGAHAGKNNKGVRDRRKLREKRRSTAIGVMHLPSTESTGGSTGEDENEENSIPSAMTKLVHLTTETTTPPEEKVKETKETKEIPKGKSESDLDADDEAAQDSSDVRTSRNDTIQLKIDNQRLTEIVEAKDKRIAVLEMQVSQLTKQMEEIKEKLLIALKPSQ